MKTIYLAHPHFKQTQAEARELQQILEEMGFNVINPLADNPFDKRLRRTKEPLKNRTFTDRLVKWCLQKIDAADVLVAYLPVPSIGTVMEIAYAAQKGKPTFVLTTAQWDMWYHPFLRKTATQVFIHLSDLQKALRELKPETAGHPRFYELLEEIRQLHDRKNADYSKAEDPLGNFRMCEAFGIPAWKGCLVRMSDKWSRLVQLANKPAPAVKDEAITDTMTDLAVYSLLCRILWEEAHGKAYSKRITV